MSSTLGADDGLDCCGGGSSGCVGPACCGGGLFGAWGAAFNRHGGRIPIAAFDEGFGKDDNNGSTRGAADGMLAPSEPCDASVAD